MASVPEPTAPAQVTDALDVEVSDLSVSYSTRDGKPVLALRDASMRADRGEFVSIVGKSGCGKSTMLKVVAGLLDDYDGTATIAGDAVDGPRRDVGVMFQSPVLLPWRTALKNVILLGSVAGRPRGELLRQARDLLRLTGLEGFEDKYPWELSGGMQQRVALSRALLGNPRLLLMDEPFGALDEFTRERLNLELLNVWEQFRPTVVLVTHKVEEAVLLSDRVVVMASSPGRVVAVEDISLPRPRGLDVISTAEFTHHVASIRKSLGVNQ
jgi:NitT/TauT family transport system ATP-binding protein